MEPNLLQKGVENHNPLLIIKHRKVKHKIEGLNLYLSLKPIIIPTPLTQIPKANPMQLSLVQIHQPEKTVLR